MLQLKPPRCIGQWVARRVEDPGVELDAVVDAWENHFFELGCACGGATFTVSSFIRRVEYLREDRAYGPIVLRCPLCDRENKCFDPELHGYDVEIDHFPQPAPYHGTFRAYACPACAAERFALTTRFQYPDNVMEPHGVAAGRAPASEDLFTYFTLIGRCSGCNAVVTIASIECA